MNSEQTIGGRELNECHTTCREAESDYGILVADNADTDFAGQIIRDRVIVQRYRRKWAARIGLQWRVERGPSRLRFPVSVQLPRSAGRY